MSVTLRVIYAALIFAASLWQPVWAQRATPYATAMDVELLKLLAPPPANDSPQTKAELAQLLAIQDTRTPEMEARARTDATIEITRFVEVVGPKFTKENLPKTAAFLARIAASANPVIDPAKDSWKRQRTHQQSDQIKPSLPLATSASYPSGTAASGMLTAIVVANLVPEKRAAIMARGRELADQRVVGGIHFPSDVEAGRMAGTLIALAIMSRDDFKSDFETARAEVLAVLGP